MQRRKIEIVDAAFRLFTRYGVKRTGMNDIAEEAGIARQTLYNAFSSKDEVLCATIDLFTERTVAAIREEMGEDHDLYRCLDIIFQHMAVAPYDMLSATPNTQDILDGFNASGQAAIAESDKALRKLLGSVLSPHADAIRASGQTVNGLADLVQISASTAKHKARSRKHLLQLLDTLKRTVLVVAGAKVS